MEITDFVEKKKKKSNNSSNEKSKKSAAAEKKSAKPSYYPEDPLDLIDRVRLTYTHKGDMYSIIVNSTHYEKNEHGFIVSTDYDTFIKGKVENPEIYKMFQRLESFCRNVENKYDAFLILIDAKYSNNDMKKLKLKFKTIPVTPSYGDVEYLKSVSPLNSVYT